MSEYPVLPDKKELDYLESQIGELVNFEISLILQKKKLKPGKVKWLSQVHKADQHTLVLSNLSICTYLTSVDYAVFVYVSYTTLHFRKYFHHVYVLWTFPVVVSCQVD